MKKIILLLLPVLALFLIAAGSCPTPRLVRMTVINKSGRKIELSLTGKDLEKFYYLHIPEGSLTAPYEQVYTIAADTYTSSLYYFEYWDPVYGNQCSTKASTLDASHNLRLTVLACDYTPPNGGEPPSIIKYGGRNTKRGR